MMKVPPPVCARALVLLILAHAANGQMARSNVAQTRSLSNMLMQHQRLSTASRAHHKRDLDAWNMPVSHQLRSNRIRLLQQPMHDATTVLRRPTVATKATENPLFNDIAGFYDSLSGIWEREYGEHMHHGWYGPGAANSMTVQEAQIALMEETAKLGDIQALKEKIEKEEGRKIRILDVGCGIGGASRWLARTFDAEVTGITLSPKQVQRARELAKEANLSEQTTFEVRNALDSGLADGSFDVVWSLEMAEHIPDRPRFLSEINRMLNKKYGRLALVTWCRKNGMLDFDEEIALNYISEWYNLPRWVSMERWASLAPDAGFKPPTPLDWSENIRPLQFWGDILKTSLEPKNIIGLLAIGDKGVKAGAAAALMGYGFYKDFIVFGAMRLDVSESN